ncbi:hypothetical protein KI688_011919 [Linnemannia hyalina]|uniref:Uncharacterized protein n=1 Tax=Linnemannia hyalina TaxID=64524 RepID=A0A9P7XVU6_9FUNG|nr:hypothetical protein KI688_011919 [Linnemannia hyalina]
MAESTPQRITEFQASDEMAPGWWDIDGLPWEDMRINHKAWYPFMLADRPFRGVYWYETRTSVEEGALNAQRETVKEIWKEKEELAWPEPTVNKSLDDVWLRNDIAQAEQTWLNTCFP